MSISSASTLPPADIGKLGSDRIRPIRPIIPDCLRLKILTMGDGGVGKTCLVKRYCEEKFQTKYISTIGVDFGVKPETVNNQICKINFWDLSGHPEFFEIRNEFYKDTQGALLVFDVTSRKSFEALDSWLKESQSFGAQNVLVYVVGNKTDSPDRQVSEMEATAWCSARNFKYWETSAKSGKNVSELFLSMFKSVVEIFPKITP